MVTYTTVPALTDQDLGKVLLANYLKDGDPAGWFAPPFLLDKAFQVASNDGLTAVVAYRAGEPYSYTVKGIPLVTKTLKYAAIPSIVSGLVATKDGTNGVAITAGVVRYLNAAKEWKEVNVGAQTVLIGVPSTGVETVYIVAYDLETTPKIDAYKPAKSLFDAAPNAATVDPQEPAIIIARVDLDGAGNVIAIFNDGIHAGLESTKAEDLREMMGVIQHNIEPKIESKLKTTLSYSDLPDRYIIGYTNFGKAKQDNRFPYIGAMVDTKPTVVNTEFMDSTGNALIQSSGNIASQELSRYSSVSNPSGEPLKRGEFVLHPIFVYLDIENTPIINYAIVRSAVVFRKRPLATEPLEKQIKKYMLEETLGNTEVPQFITDFCTLCGFFVVDDAMDLRTNIAEALIVPATEGFSSIQERPSSLSAPTKAEEGLLLVKEGDTAVAKGLPTLADGHFYVKSPNGFTGLGQDVRTFAQIRLSSKGLSDSFGYNKDGKIADDIITKLLSNIDSRMVFGMSQNFGDSFYISMPATLGVINGGWTAGNEYTQYKVYLENAFFREWFLTTFHQPSTEFQNNLYTSIFGTGATAQKVREGLIHFNIRLTVGTPSFDYDNTQTFEFNSIKQVDMLDNLFHYLKFRQTEKATLPNSSNRGQTLLKNNASFVTIGDNKISTLLSTMDTPYTGDDNYNPTSSRLYSFRTDPWNYVWINRNTELGFNGAPTKPFFFCPEKPYTTEQLSANQIAYINSNIMESGIKLETDKIFNDFKYNSFFSNQKCFSLAMISTGRRTEFDVTLPNLGTNAGNNIIGDDITQYDILFSTTQELNVKGKQAPAVFLKSILSPVTGRNVPEIVLFKSVYGGGSFTLQQFYAIEYRLDIEIYSNKD